MLKRELALQTEAGVCTFDESHSTAAASTKILQADDSSQHHAEQLLSTASNWRTLMWVRLWSRLWQYDASALLGIDHTHVPECAAPHETFQFKKTLVTALSIFFFFFPCTVPRTRLVSLCSKYTVTKFNDMPDK